MEQRNLPDCLPDWPGASEAYSRAYARLEQQNAAAYSAQLSEHLRRGRSRKTFRFSVPEECSRVIAALNRGDEAVIKAYNLGISV